MRRRELSIAVMIHGGYLAPEIAIKDRFTETYGEEVRWNSRGEASSDSTLPRAGGKHGPNLSDTVILQDMH
jgi:hypothetical protein